MSLYDTPLTERVAYAVLDDLKDRFTEAQAACNSADYDSAMRNAKRTLKRSVVLRRFLSNALRGMET